jgi:euchromatic histone-lysine N-methyltransferase
MLTTKRKQIAQAVVNDQMKNRLEGTLQRSVFDWKIKGKRPPREEKQVPRAVVDDNMKNILEGSLQRINLRTPLSDPINAMTRKWVGEWQDEFDNAW